jgi:PleD family two-component response regulator
MARLAICDWPLGFFEFLPKPLCHPPHPNSEHGEVLQARSPSSVTAMVKSVLIADDNALIRQRLGELFSGEPDFEVCAVAETGRKAIEEAQESRPDLILLDLSMPVMNGLDAARALQRLMPECR